MPAKLNIIGQTFGRGKVIGEAPSITTQAGNTRRRSILICTCGTEYVADNAHLRAGNIKSCGCLSVETIIAAHIKHGYTSGRSWPRIYGVWVNMRDRCNNPKNKRYKHYGGRGIKVCQEWSDFAQFVRDMGPGKKGWTIERLNNEIGYSLQNCVWATFTHQARNRRNNVRYTVQGISGCLTELSEYFGLRVGTVWGRIHKLKWSTDRAFLTPVGCRIIRAA